MIFLKKSTKHSDVSSVCPLSDAAFSPLAKRSLQLNLMPNLQGLINFDMVTWIESSAAGMAECNRGHMSHAITSMAAVNTSPHLAAPNAHASECHVNLHVILGDSAQRRGTCRTRSSLGTKSILFFWGFQYKQVISISDKATNVANQPFCSVDRNFSFTH